MVVHNRDGDPGWAQREWLGRESGLGVLVTIFVVLKLLMALPSTPGEQGPNSVGPLS